MESFVSMLVMLVWTVQAGSDRGPLGTGSPDMGCMDAGCCAPCRDLLEGKHIIA